MHNLIESLEPRKLLSETTDVITSFVPIDPGTGEAIEQPKMNASALVRGGWKLLEAENGYRWWVPGHSPEFIEECEKITWDGEEYWARRGHWTIEFEFDGGKLYLFPPDDAPPGWIPPAPTAPPNYHELIANLGFELVYPHYYHGSPGYGKQHTSVEVKLPEGMTEQQFRQAVAGLPDVANIKPSPVGLFFFCVIIDDSRVHYDIDVTPYPHELADTTPVVFWNPLKDAQANEPTLAEPAPTQPLSVQRPVTPAVFSTQPLDEREASYDLFAERHDLLNDPPLALPI